MNLDEFQAQLGIRFENVELLRQSLTHRSYLNEHVDEALHDNERMEFLGDAILDFVVADMLYREFPEMQEGELTRLRAALVRTDALAELGADCQLGEVLLVGKGEEHSGGRKRRNNLCRGFESLIGAMYLDQGLDAVRTFVIPRMTRLLNHVLAEGLHIDARSQLQEWSQARMSVTPVYRTVAASGPDHNKQFMIEVSIGEKIMGRGTGNSKQTAAQDAARSALKRIETSEDVPHSV